jgi:uncharacterized protein (TIGR00297 family)
MQILIGAFFGIVIALLAWRVHALSHSGALAAAVTGGLIFSLGGLSWATLLLAFFISSSALSRAFASKKSSLSEKFAKGSKRDWGQVMANGGLGAGLAIIHSLLPELSWPWFAFAGAMAAVNADTWSTEVGVLNPTPPRLISNGRSVERGTSGGISRLGSLAALGGAVFIAVLAGLFSIGGTSSWESITLTIAIVTLGGLGGAFFDSYLGATVQAIYWCSTCQKETEHHPLHICGTHTSHERGWSWMNNDAVNFTASITGALLVMGVRFLLF